MTAAAPEKCDLIIRNAYVLTMDPRRTVHPAGAIAVRGHSIVGVGPQAQILSAWRSARVIDAQGAIVHPGFVDAHLHVNAQTCRGFFRGDASKGGSSGPSYADWKAALRPEDEQASPPSSSQAAPSSPMRSPQRPRRPGCAALSPIPICGTTCR